MTGASEGGWDRKLAIDAARPLSLKAAAELAGVSVSSLRRRAREGRLAVENDGGSSTSVTLGALVEAGLVADDVVLEPTGAESNAAGGLPVPVQADAGTWIPAAQGQEILRRLLAESEAADQRWTERAERLYREMLDEQRDRLRRLEKENRDLKSELQDALRRIPKLLELEKLEQEHRALADELLDARERCGGLEAERTELRSELAGAESRLKDCERRNVELVGTVRRLRGRGLWDRVLDRDQAPLPEA